MLSVTRCRLGNPFSSTLVAQFVSRAFAFRMNPHKTGKRIRRNMAAILGAKRSGVKRRPRFCFGRNPFRDAAHDTVRQQNADMAVWITPNFRMPLGDHVIERLGWREQIEIRDHEEQASPAGARTMGNKIQIMKGIMKALK